MEKNEDQLLKVGKKYKHCKGKIYRVVGFYESNEESIDLINYRKWGTPVIDATNGSGDKLVEVYVTKWELKNEDTPYKIIILDSNGKLLEGNYILYDALYQQENVTMFIREYNEFMSFAPMEKEKNPYNQKYRFEYSDI